MKAEVSVYNRYEHRNKNNRRDIFLHNERDPDYCYKESQHRGQTGKELMFAQWDGAGRRKRSSCIKPNSGKGVLNNTTSTNNADAEKVGYGCVDPSSSEWLTSLYKNSEEQGNGEHDERRDKIPENGHRYQCKWDNITADILKRHSTHENFGKYAKNSEGITVYEQLLTQYCRNSDNILDVVIDQPKHNRCVDISENPKNITNLNVSIKDENNVTGMVSQEMKNEFCKKHPDNDYCGCLNLVTLDCATHEHKYKPGCKEYVKKYNDAEDEDNATILAMREETGVQSQHCAVPRVCNQEDIYRPTNLQPGDCPATLICNQKMDFTDSDLQAGNNIYVDQKCEQDLDYSAQIVDPAVEPGDGSISHSTNASDSSTRTNSTPGSSRPTRPARDGKTTAPPIDNLQYAAMAFVFLMLLISSCGGMGMMMLSMK